MKALDKEGLDYLANKVYDAINSGGSADYIVEQGQESVWTYRKWASGIAECWFTRPSTGPIALTTAWVSPVYYSGSAYSRYAYPVGLFIDVPTVHATLDSNPSSVWLMTRGTSGTQGTKDSTPAYQFARAGSIESADISLMITARGFWKEFTPSVSGSTYSPIDLQSLNANALQYKKCSALNITNTNNLLCNGIYSGYSMTNAPQTGWMLYLVLLHDNNSNYVEQIAFPVGSPAKFWRRTLNGADNWSSWNVYNQN